MMDRLESFDTTDLMDFVTPPKIKLIGTGGAGNNTLFTVITYEMFSAMFRGLGQMLSTGCWFEQY